MDGEQRGLFLRVHGDLLTAAYWRDVKQRRIEGRITQVVPYGRPMIPAPDH
jgi:isocitrate dehydrogenase kinase/phosphatase